MFVRLIHQENGFFTFHSFFEILEIHFSIYVAISFENYYTVDSDFEVYYKINNFFCIKLTSSISYPELDSKLHNEIVNYFKLEEDIVIKNITEILKAVERR